MLAVRQHESGRITLAEIARPRCPDDGVLIDVDLCGICGSDLLMASGARQLPQQPLGHEYVGTIRQAGEQVAGFKVGDRVCVDAVSHCGLCPMCREGRTNLCNSRVFVPLGGPGGLSEVAVAHASTLHIVPDSVSSANGALAEPLSVALHALHKLPKDVRSLLIVGAGSVGLCVLLCSKATGIRHVEVIARYPHQVAAADELGASVASLATPASQKFEHAIVTATGGALDMAIRYCDFGGTIVTVAGYSAAESVQLRPLVSKELTIVGSICAGYHDQHAEMDTVLDWLADKVIQPQSLVTHTFQFDQIHEAFRTAADKKTGSIKVHVQVGNGGDLNAR